MANPHPNKENQFKPGNPGGPGRPKGSRDKLSFDFIEGLSKTFEEEGIESLRELMKKQPAQYHNIIAKLMPKIMELSGRDGEELTVYSKIERSVVHGNTED